jgi:hypothetical protein
MVILGGETDYTVNFRNDTTNFTVDTDYFSLKKANQSLVISFGSGWFIDEGCFSCFALHISLRYV